MQSSCFSIKFAFRQSNKKISGAFSNFECNWINGVKKQNIIWQVMALSGISAGRRWMGRTFLWTCLCLVLGAPFWYYPVKLAIQTRQFSYLSRMEHGDEGLLQFVFHQEEYSRIRIGKREFLHKGLMHDIHSIEQKGDSLHIAAVADYAETEWLKLTYRYKNPPPGVSLNASFFFLFYFFQPLPFLAEAVFLNQRLKPAGPDGLLFQGNEEVLSPPPEGGAF